jgi:hypothetical protein
MADGHVVAYNAVEIIPAGLADGQNGNGFTGPGGAPGNNTYQEAGGFENTCEVLSRGHYCEGVGSLVEDNVGRSGVPARLVSFLGVVNKDAASAAYPSFGVEIRSTGPASGANSPSYAYYADGAWLHGLFFDSATFHGNAIDLANGQTVGVAGQVNETFGARGMVASGGVHRPASTSFASLSTIDPSPQVGDYVAISDASACIANTVITGGGGRTHACAAVYNGEGWVALVTH